MTNYIYTSLYRLNIFYDISCRISLCLKIFRKYHFILTCGLQKIKLDIDTGSTLTLCGNLILP